MGRTPTVRIAARWGRPSPREFGAACELATKRIFERRCRILLPLRKGADFFCLTDDGRIIFIEAKAGGSKLTRNERMARQLAERLGIEYEVVRCEKEGY